MSSLKQFEGERDEVQARNFGFLNVKNYHGKNVIIQALTAEARVQRQKYIGRIQMLIENTKTIWYFQATDGEKFRIPEPADGIDELFDIEFKRQDL